MADKALHEGKISLLSSYFSKTHQNPFDQIKWVKRNAQINNEKGEAIFEQKDVEFPENWTQTAVNVVASKYFRGKLGTTERENSVKQLISRVADTITEWGIKGNYFDEDEAKVFNKELTFLLVNQAAAFNSPVWFNVGFEKRPQTSACFINSVEDSMESILDLAKTEGMLFKYGSGSGVNLSTIRSAKESLSSGGEPSGPVSFMKGLDSFAGVIKSGGRTRRAAKMVVLNADHPDIEEFIKCKEKEEKKAWALIDAGYDGSFNGEAYGSVQFQNANNSVRVTDEFMQAVKSGTPWTTKAITDGRVVSTHSALRLLEMAAESAHVCGDPGIQFDTTINNWHTCPNSGRINGSNPCSEYMFLDDTACNLASLNLLMFYKPNGFDITAFKQAVRVLILAQEILVDFSSYPTPTIQQNSHAYRPLGLGYANLGALLMTKGLPYDSEDGRNYAAAITSIMCGEAYKMSALIASKVGQFSGFAINRDAMLKVIGKHAQASYALPISLDELYSSAADSWEEAIELGMEHGFRNSQVTVLAPTGTIGFMMDCDTTGVEPDIALVKYKKLAGAGEGMMRLVNKSVREALYNLEYDASTTDKIIAYIEKNDTIEGCPELNRKHLSIFDCAFKPANGTRSIHWLGHLRMCAAVQPFLSGAISKTVNCPNNATVRDILDAYILAWELGLKAVAIYRDGSKRSQPLTTKLDNKPGVVTAPATLAKPYRKKLPDERQSITHKFSIAGHEGYLTAGMYDDGTLGELFITMSKEGSVVSGLINSVAEATSIALQYGVPLKVLVTKFSHTRFEPSGFTTNRDIPMANSVVDYVFRWLEKKFLAPKCAPCEEKAMPELEEKSSEGYVAQSDAPPCSTCGSFTVRNGSCYKCMNCGGTSGCS